MFHVPKEQHKGKLGKRAQDCYLLGYPEAGAGWWFWLTTKWRMIHSTLAVFPEFQALQVKKKVMKKDIDFLLNKVKLILGEESTEKLAEEELKTIEQLPSGPTHGLPMNIKAALRSYAAENWNASSNYQ
jgi:hypothetical protein